jgi:hypothetical protein
MLEAWQSPHTAVWGWFKSFLRRISFSPPARLRAEFNLGSRGRKDLNDPHTAVWGIRNSFPLGLPLLERDLNDPHTAVWGIQNSFPLGLPLLERDLNDPPHCRVGDSK